MAEIWVRILTGTGLIAVLLVGTMRDVATFFFVFGAIGALCLIEYFNVVYSKNQRNELNTIRKFFGILLGIMPFFWMTLYLYNSEWYANPTALGLAIIPFFLLMIFELFAKAPDPIKNLAFTGFGVLYIGVPFMMLLYLQEFYGPRLILGIVMLVFMNDSLAYVVGRWKGKTPLFPRISPKKTWEGALGGGICTFGLAISYPFIFFRNGPYFWDWMIIAALIVVLGPIGDLTESMLKRNFDVKDSGSLLPGHGGFLDRFDALIFIIPFVTIYFLLTT